MSMEEVNSELSRAKKTLNSAKLLLDNDYYEDAISRSYYAVLHAAKAVLILEGISTSSHRAVRRLFGQHIIKTGKIDVKYGKIFNMEQDNRVKADYDAMYFVEYADAQECWGDAKEFLEVIDQHIMKYGKKI